MSQYPSVVLHPCISFQTLYCRTVLVFFTFVFLHTLLDYEKHYLDPSVHPVQVTLICLHVLCVSHKKEMDEGLLSPSDAVATVWLL